jgi:hypothetical protein
MLSNNMLLITVKGRKTGKEYTLPINYYCENGNLWVLTNRDRTWWRNIQDGADVSLLLKRQPVRAYAVPEMETQSVEHLLSDYLKHIPQAAKPLAIRMENGTPRCEDIERVATERLFVRIEPRLPEK